MELYEEVEVKEKSKLPIIIGICIGVLLVMIVLIICAIIYLKGSMLKVKLDGKSVNGIEESLYVLDDEGEKKIYISVRDIAKYFDYEDYRGDYIVKSEDESKCYVKNEYEIAMFTDKSNDLIKTRGDSDYEYITLDEKTFEKEGKLYTTPNGIEQAFNVLFDYDMQKNTINIFSMDYLNDLYADKLGIGGEKSSKTLLDEFSNKKAIFQNLMIIMENEKYGIINAITGDAVLETKYEYIEYLPSTSDFLIRSNGKYGIFDKEAVLRAKIIYDEIKIMDSQNGLYLVKKNSLYGVIDQNGKTIIEPIYQQIGINGSTYQQNGVENEYILLNELIPIKNSDGLWGIFNLKGEKIKDFEFEGIGCSDVKEAGAYPVVIIPSYKIIIVKKDEHYNLMTSTGELLINSNILNSVYIKLNNETDEKSFYMTYNNNEKVMNIGDWLTSIGK